ncbi:hypothetical protein [Tropicibacter naphthalenivorans]|uniref:Uncharacterized protein n=1 Tax=Tropicibacter naphthalenivorans TaxID=441103 RepID=A0A0N7LZW0_9RHOB|nr:hypothetical protein [Tropicibacter naphthalenivorans]CUH78761.1 hypothetical protein TRN7648_02149 [Tropicibacter naphthalenivorans]SMC81435.1 hypothetical protein SAMN04488093_104311 [Tropicibacter naphthalenivorans]
MMTTLIAILTLAVSSFMVLGSLRTVATDTIDILATSAARAKTNGQLTQKLAFVMLWLMIFALSYL